MLGMSAPADASELQRGGGFIFYDGNGGMKEGREGGLLPLLSGDQCSASERWLAGWLAGWLLGIPQWDYSGQENMESQRKKTLI